MDIGEAMCAMRSSARTVVEAEAEVEAEASASALGSPRVAKEEGTPSTNSTNKPLLFLNDNKHPRN